MILLIIISCNPQPIYLFGEEMRCTEQARRSRHRSHAQLREGSEHSERQPGPAPGRGS
jgi:hypothetical protein